MMDAAGWVGGKGTRTVYSANSHDVGEDVFMFKTRRIVDIVFFFCNGNRNDLHYIRQGTNHFPTGFLMSIAVAQFPYFLQQRHSDPFKTE